MKRKLDKIFYPKTIAVIGASNRQGTVGYNIMRNILASDFEGEAYPVNLKYTKIQGLQSYRKVKDIPKEIDLAIIATPFKSVAKLVEECGKEGIEGLVIISAGFKEAGVKGSDMCRQITKIARKYGIRIIGPNCLGFINSANRLNASFAKRMALPGRIAFISQSGALSTSILDWSIQQNVGFSYFISIGSTLDVGYHDLIDYFGSDPGTACILIYMESLHDARAFMSAARAFSRSKPIVVLKAGKSLEGAKATLSHTGVLAGNDAAFDAAFRRAGIIRVATVAQLFHCAQALAMQTRPEGNRLAIVTNAGGPGILAMDYLVGNGGQLAELSPSSKAASDKVLSISWRHKKPADEGGDTAGHYGVAIKSCLEDKTDGVLVIHTPQAANDAIEVAKELVRIAKTSRKAIFCCWMGEEDVQNGRDYLELNKIPTFRYPESAVNTFLRLYSYSRNIKLLYETPPAIPEHFTLDKGAARALVDKVVAENRYRLSEREGKELLSYYDIPVNKGKIVFSSKEAIEITENIGYPVAMKIASPAISLKTDIGAVQLNIGSPEMVKKAYEEIINNARKNQPNVEINGLLIEPMVHKKYELILGATKDPIFGPVILFGMGGVTVELFKDQNAGIPPLNMALAQRLIEGTKIYELLKGYRGSPGIDLEDLKFLLCKFSYLLMDLPEIQTIDINPYAVDESGGLVLDAMVILDKNICQNPVKPYEHLVIRPYPSQFQKTIKLKNGQTALLRPIRPEDEPLEAEMFDYLSKETIYFRFFGYVPQVTHSMLTRFTHIDYDREMAIVAEINEDDKKRMAGVVRLISDPWKETAEYAIVVADPWQGQGLGNELTDFIIEIARQSDIKKIVASVLPHNQGMIHIFKGKGFKIRSDGYDTLMAEMKL